MELLRRILRRIGHGLYWLFASIFGDFNWSAPRWMRATGAGASRGAAWTKAHPGKFGGGVAAIALLVAGGWFGWHWWANRPKPYEPPLIAFKVDAPARTEYDQTPIVIHPLKVEFDHSIAPIAL